MKAILLPIKSKWLAMELNGDKKIEVRRGTRLYKASQKLIKEQGFARYLFYCSKGSPWICWVEGVAKINNGRGCVRSYKSLKNFNGKVVAQCDCNIVEEIKLHCLTKYNSYGLSSVVCEYTTKTLTHAKFKEQSCLTSADLEDYFANALVEKHSIIGTAIHIEDLVIFDKPKELGEFQTKTKINELRTPFYPYMGGNRGIRVQDVFMTKPLTKAPQNFCYVESEE